MRTAGVPWRCLSPPSVDGELTTTQTSLVRRGILASRGPSRAHPLRRAADPATNQSQNSYTICGDTTRGRGCRS